MFCLSLLVLVCYCLILLSNSYNFLCYCRLVTDDQGANAEKQDSTECCDVASQNVKNKEEVATVKEEITPTPREEFIVPHHPPPRDHLRLSMESQPHDSAEKGWKSDIKDKIVSPVVPQPRITASKFRHMPGIRVEKVAKGQKTPKFNDKNARFHYGNYNRYVFLNVHPSFLVFFLFISF